MQNNDRTDVSLMKEWFHARDVFLGTNYQERNFSKGFALASSCLHKDAKWLVDVVERNGLPVNLHAAKKMFESEPGSMAVCFAASMDWMSDIELLKKAARMGCGMAQGKLALGLLHTWLVQQSS